MNFVSRPLRAVATLALLLSATSALAQVPSTADPSRLIDRHGGAPRATPSANIVIEKSGDEVAPAKGSTQKVFVLKNVVLEGSTVYGAAGPRSAYEKFVGQSVSFADLQTIAGAMTAQYRNDGYILSRVVLKPQKVGGGEVHFQALEGYVDAIQLTGEIKGDKELIEAFANKIKTERPLNAKTLERYLLLMDDLPGVTARSVLKASPTQKGASNLIVTLLDQSYEASLQGDNRGNRFIGPYQLTAVGAVNSAFGMYDRNTLRLAASSDFDELLYGEYVSEFQLGTEGTRLTSRIAAAETRPGSTLSSLDLHGTSKLLEFAVLHPALRSRDENLFLRSVFRLQNSDNESLGVELFEDHVRHISAGLDYDVTDTWAGINRMGLTVTQGLEIFDSTSDGTGRSRITGEHDFTRFNANYTRVQDIAGDVSLFASVDGQASLDPLLSSEQYGIGGESYGRAYDGGEIVGDHGLAGILELRYSGSMDDQSIVRSYQPYIFYDAGAVWLIDKAVGEQSRESLTSAGLGTRFNLVEDFSGYVELSFPITRDVGSKGNDESRIFFNVIKRFGADS